MSTSIDASALVLVAILPSPRDFEIARVLGWYRIPLRKAPKVIEVDTLAFYQTASFGKEERWRISYIAEQRGHELTNRRDLFKDEPDHPHAHEEYYKIQLGPLQPLAKPILAGKWRRITFLYTTGRHLLQASTINDLVVESEEREVLWRSLRERALTSGRYQASDLPEAAVDPLLLELLGAMSLLAGKEKTL